MPFERADLATLIARDQADTAARLPGVDPALRRSLVGVLSAVRAGSVHGLYGYLDWLARQLMPDTAELEHLERWASIWKISRLAATSASGLASFAGLSGSAIPLGTLLMRADGVEYSTTEEGLVAAGVATVPVQAAVPGAAGNANPGILLSLVSPVSGVQAQASAALGLAGGTDTETDASLRQRLLLRIRKPPKGGAADDYEGWALDYCPGVTRAWTSPKELGTGTVTLRFVMDATYADGIPQAEDVAMVQAVLETLRPVTAELYVVAPVPQALGLSIRLTPDLASVRAAVEAELLDMLRSEAVPGGTILISHVREAISIALGETDHVLLAPTEDVVCAAGEIAVVGDIDWGA
jgi:uncharacterized phage protein gp47/JayE